MGETQRGRPLKSSDVNIKIVYFLTLKLGKSHQTELEVVLHSTP